MSDNEYVDPIPGILVAMGSVALTPVIFILGMILDKHLVEQGASLDTRGPLSLLFIVGSLAVGCFGFFIGLYMINPWLPAAYIVQKNLTRRRNRFEE